MRYPIEDGKRYPRDILDFTSSFRSKRREGKLEGNTMNSQTSKSVCEHEWEEYDDPAAYNDGFNSPVVAICTKCGAERDIRQKYADINKMKWSETILFLPVFLLITIYLTTIAPIIILISGIKDEFSSKRKAG